MSAWLQSILRAQLRRPGRSVGGLALAALALWGAERWGGDLMPTGWKLAFNSRECRVEKITDGDTMNVRCGTELVKVRLYCIDAPELSQKPWGTRSREYLQSITPPTVRLLKIDQDRYGRIVGELYTADSERRLLNLAQVENGQAAVYPQYCASERYFSAERAARADQRGIWSRRGVHQQPWDYRRQARH